MDPVCVVRTFQLAFISLWSAALLGISWTVYVQSLDALLVFVGLFVFSSLMLLADLLEYLLRRYAIEKGPSSRACSPGDALLDPLTNR